jgi:hypothetical protein
MFKLWLRLVGLLFIAVALMLMIMMLVGQLIPSKVVIEYHRQGGLDYPAYIRDANRAFTLHLAGNRCFRQIPAEPEWNANRHQYEPNYYPETYHVSDLNSDAAVKQVHC